MTFRLFQLLLLACVGACGPSTSGADDVSDSVGTRFRLVEGGRFVQGTSGGERALKRAFPLSTTGQFYGNSEDPAHVTWITKPFYLAATEVTVDQFAAFVKATGYETSAERETTQIDTKISGKRGLGLPGERQALAFKRERR